MATESGGSRPDEIKAHFRTREGTYRLSTLSEYKRPNRTEYVENGNTAVSLSFTHLPANIDTPERLCFNIGKELYVYHYKGPRKAADLTQPTDKRSYKGTFPTSHAFCDVVDYPSQGSLLLLVGFSAGQIHLIDPINQDVSTLFNEERQIEKSRVTCIDWYPNSRDQFIVSHASGDLYIYTLEPGSPPTPPCYTVFKQGEGFVVFACKTKATRNPMFKWHIGDGAIYRFRFSPCRQYLAVVSQDGFLRVFDFDKMELLGYMRSYFGGLRCVNWSADGKYIVTGGEDDLITIYSFHENRVICRCQGHKSWVTDVAFDPFTTSVFSNDDVDYNSDDDSLAHSPHNITSNAGLRESLRSSNSSRYSLRLDAAGNALPLANYRVGSVSQDTNLCLWDITSEVLHSHLSKTRTSSTISKTLEVQTNLNQSFSSLSMKSNSVHPAGLASGSSTPMVSPHSTIANGHATRRKTFTLGHRDKNSIRSNSAAVANSARQSVDSHKLLGTPMCPRLQEVAVLAPLICKKLAHAMLTSLYFYKDCLIVSNQDGVVSTYARPHKQTLLGHDASDLHLSNNHLTSRSNPSANTNGGMVDEHSPRPGYSW